MYIESCLFYDIYQGMASPFPKGEIHVPLLTIGMENRKGLPSPCLLCTHPVRDRLRKRENFLI